MELDQDGVAHHATPLAPSPLEEETMDSSPTTPVVPNAILSGEADGVFVETHDSMVTVRLSEPPVLTVNTNVGPNSAAAPAKPQFGHEYKPSDAMAEVVQEEDWGLDEDADRNATVAQQDEGGPEGHQFPDDVATPTSESDDDVDWEELQRTEDQESKDQQSDNTALLLAKLEQENDKLATNPKTIKVQVVESPRSPTRHPRPPSMAQLRDMFQGPAPPALRYSMLPPPPMTDLEFYAALVKDYQQTAARLPTLLSNKIRRGVPPPLRGVVWQSMANARDAALEEQFERFSGESSPYEGIIGKDLGRSFPGVDMFRDPEGDGQRMLGRVLKCYSLHDPKIGYCQGLAFLVGPLLMHMPDKQAFCVLANLMDNYGLRSSYTPELSGLHVRIYQFSELLRQLVPAVSSHLDDLQVDPAYVSQWFLSFFAVTSPLPMLFRIFDVIFAEGAAETIMRVALSLMQKNQGRILACTEMEDVLQLLLSRGLWDCYHYNADELVHDFTSLSDVVSRERLAALEQGYRERQLANPNNSSPNAARMSEVTTAASRFLGRLWVSTSGASASSPSQSSTNKSRSSPGTLSPGLTAPPRPLSMLRRSTSKQSLASTLNSMEASSSASVLSTASTEATFISRDSGASDDPTTVPGFPGTGSKPTTAAAAGHAGNRNNSDSRYLHSQIEDLLTALSDLQRQHALLADQLQREREERSEDQKTVRVLLDGLRQKGAATTSAAAATGGTGRVILIGVGSGPTDGSATKPGARPTEQELSQLVDAVEQRFGPETAGRRCSIQQTKTQLRDELVRAKEQLVNELAKGQDSRRRMQDVEQELATTKDQLRDSHAHVRVLHQDKQRLEKQMHDLRSRGGGAGGGAAVVVTDTSAAANATTGMAIVEAASDWFSRTNIGSTMSVPAPAPPPSSTGGLRELKLGRSRSTPSQASTVGSVFNKRASSVLRGGGDSVAAGQATPPANEQDALLLDLVHAKTAEAIARQEADEAKQKLENLRKAFGLAPGDTPPAAHNSTVAGNAAAQASAAASAAMGMIGRFTTSMGEGNKTAPGPAPASAPPTTTAGSTSGYGNFFGWRRS